MSVKFVSLSVPVWRGPEVVVVVGEDLLSPPDDLVSHESYDHSKEGMFDHLKVAVSLVTELVVDLVAQCCPVAEETAIPLWDIHTEIRLETPGLGSEVAQGEVISGGLVGGLCRHISLVNLILRHPDSIEITHQVSRVESSPGEDSILGFRDGGGGDVD